MHLIKVVFLQLSGNKQDICLNLNYAMFMFTYIYLLIVVGEVTYTFFEVTVN